MSARGIGLGRAHDRPRSVGEYSGIVGILGRLYVPRVVLRGDLSDLGSLLRQHPRLLICTNHGPLMGPLAAFVALHDQFVRAGGERRKILVIAWRGFYRIPLVRLFAQYATQTSRPLSVQGYLDAFSKHEFSDFLVMPEGDNSAFGNGDDIEPFRSHRFVEIAVRMGIPVLLMVHQGSSRWSRIFRLPFSPRWRDRLLPQGLMPRMRISGQLNLPPLFPARLPEVRVSFRLYVPKTSAAQIATGGGEESLRRDADAIRCEMISLCSLLRE